MVQFGPDTTYGRSTAWYPVSYAAPGAAQQNTILVAGMKASTTYHMLVQTKCSGTTYTGSDFTYTTGALPSSVGIPAMAVSRPNPAPGSPENPGIEMVTVTVGDTPAYFTDRDGNTIWYYNSGAGDSVQTFKLLSTGNFLVSLGIPFEKSISPP
jgi:hypothetical protein